MNNTAIAIAIAIIVIIVIYLFTTYQSTNVRYIMGMCDANGFTYAVAKHYKNNRWQYAFVLHTDELYEAIDSTLKDIILMCYALEQNGWKYMDLEDERLKIVKGEDSYKMLELPSVDTLISSGELTRNQLDEKVASILDHLKRAVKSPRFKGKQMMEY